MQRSTIVEDRKRQIIDAFESCLSKKPYDAVTAREIASKAGISTGLLYYYYKNKEDILLAYVNQSISKLSAIVVKWGSAVHSNASDFKTFLLDLLPFSRSYFSAMSSDDLRMFTNTWALSAGNPKVRRILCDQYDLFNETFASVIKSGNFKTPDAEMTAKFLCCLLDGLAVNMVLYPDEGDPTGFFEHLIELL